MKSRFFEMRRQSLQKRFSYRRNNGIAGKRAVIKILIAVILLLFASTLTLVGVEPDGKSKGSVIDLSDSSKVVPLSLKSFIDLAASADRTFQGYLIDRSKIRYSEILDSPAEEILLSGAINYGLNFHDLEDNDGFSGNVAISKLFASTGTELGAIFGSTEKTTSLSLSVGQDIVKNAFGQQGRWQKELAGISRELAEYQTVEAYEDYFAAVAGHWYKWVSLYRAFENSKSTYNESLVLYNLVAKKRTSGIASQSDLNRAYLQLVSANSDLISAEEAFVNQELRVKLIAGIDPGKKIVPQTKDPFPFEGEYPPLGSSTKEDELVFKGYVQKSRTGEILDLLIRDAEIDLKTARNDLLPSVKLNIGYDLSSVSGYGSDFDYSNGKNGLSLGLSFSYSIWSKRDRAAFSSAQLERERADITVADTEAQLELNLRQLSASIFSLTRQAELAKTKVTLLEQIYRETNLRYNRGQSTLNELVSDIQSLSQGRYRYSILSIELDQLKIEWLRLTDQLVAEMPKE